LLLGKKERRAYVIYEFRMKMADEGVFNVKEQILDSGEGDEPCREYGKAFGKHTQRNCKG
jgi:hypothetical protein